MEEQDPKMVISSEQVAISAEVDIPVVHQVMMVSNGEGGEEDEN